MQTVPPLGQDDLDRWITQVLTASTGDAQPSEQVWQRIVCHVVSADQNPQDGTGQPAMRSKHEGGLIARRGD